MLLFSNLKPRRLPEALFWYEILKFFKIFKKIHNFQTKIELREASCRPPGFQIWKKEHLSFHWKKIIPLSCLEKILDFVTYLASKWVWALISDVLYLSFFQHFLKESQNFKLNTASESLLEAFWVSDLKKAISQLSLEKKIIPLSFFVLNKIKICKHKYSETDWFCWKNDRYGISENRCHASPWWKIHYKT